MGTLLPPPRRPGPQPAARAAAPPDDASGAGLAQFAGDEPTPAFVAEVADECERLLDRLGDSELRQIALWKMAGDTNHEIAAKFACAPATVERRLALIRRTWEQEAAGD